MKNLCPKQRDDGGKGLGLLLGKIPKIEDRARSLDCSWDITVAAQQGNLTPLPRNPYRDCMLLDGEFKFKCGSTTVLGKGQWLCSRSGWSCGSDMFQ